MMNALEMLLGRTSSPMLEGEPPTEQQLELMLRAAARAPDHGSLQPYRFIRIQGEGLDSLAELFVAAAEEAEGELPEARLTKLRRMPRRAPMILVAVAVTQEHPKVPVGEQLITAGCAAHGVVQAAFAQGIGAMWRSGEMAFNPRVKRGLGLADHEEIVGFIYLGQVVKSREAPTVDPARLVSDWNGRS